MIQVYTIRNSDNEVSIACTSIHHFCLQSVMRLLLQQAKWVIQAIQKQVNGIFSTLIKTKSTSVNKLKKHRLI